VKLSKKINLFNTFLVVLCIIAILEVLFIIKDVLYIKRENTLLKTEIHKLEKQKRDSDENNISLKSKISKFQEPDISNIDIPDGWRLYRYLDYGFEIAYPSSWKVSINSQDKSKTEDDIEARVSVYNDNPTECIDINIISLKTYNSINEYIKQKYNYKVYVKKSIYVNNQKYDVYKLSGEKHYFIFIKNKSYIFDVNSASEEFLLKIFETFKFI
jgi:hypothetical protein